MTFTRCRTCVMPNTRPDTPFIDGECSACVSYRKRRQVGWGERYAALAKLLERHDGRLIVPSSGGKDSTYQALTLKNLGADVTCVTATTCHLTPIGRKNIDNLARHCRTIEVTPDRTTRATLNRMGLEMVGDISWPEHVAIFTTPFRMAKALGISLIMYGENPQEAYGGPKGTEEAVQMTRRWVSEFGGFLGMRIQDVADQIGAQAAADYMMPDNLAIDGILPKQIEAHWLGQYIEWDSHRNAKTAIAAGMRACTPSMANYWSAENLDNAQTGIHDHFMYRKYGYGRGCAQVSVDVRMGRETRSSALEWVRSYDGLFPVTYAGVSISEVLDRIGMTVTDFERQLVQWTNKDLFEPIDPNYICSRPILKEED